jgi:hypothetical protein
VAQNVVGDGQNSFEPGVDAGCPLPAKVLRPKQNELVFLGFKDRFKRLTTGFFLAGRVVIADRVQNVCMGLFQ